MTAGGERTFRALSIHAALNRLGYRGPFSPPLRWAMKAALPGTVSAADRRSLVQLIGWLLGEPEQCCRAILQEFLFQRAVSAKRWSDVMGARVTVPAVVEQVTLQDADELGTFLHSHSRGLIVATYHAGDYLSMLLKLTTLLPRERHLHVLRRANAQTRRANGVLPTLLPNVRVVLDDGTSLRSAVRALRQGHLLAVLCDLPESWGAGTPIRLFGRVLRWTRSPIDFARLGRADLLPLTSQLTGRGWCLATAYPLIPAERLGQQAAMQRLAHIAEEQIRRFPGQWHQWPLLPAMRDTTRGGEARA